MEHRAILQATYIWWWKAPSTGASLGSRDARVWAKVSVGIKTSDMWLMHTEWGHSLAQGTTRGPGCEGAGRQHRRWQRARSAPEKQHLRRVSAIHVPDEDRSLLDAGREHMCRVCGWQQLRTVFWWPQSVGVGEWYTSFLVSREIHEASTPAHLGENFYVSSWFVVNLFVWGVNFFRYLAWYFLFFTFVLSYTLSVLSVHKECESSTIIHGPSQHSFIL